MIWLQSLRWWARSDRIRTSPRDGKLLRLRIGACVRVGKTFAQVTDRTVYETDHTGNPRGLDYTCHTTTGEFHLGVFATAAGGIRVQLVTNGRPTAIDAQDVETFG